MQKIYLIKEEVASLQRWSFVVIAISISCNYIQACNFCKHSIFILFASSLFSYFLASFFLCDYKIGVSEEEYRRLKELQTGNSENIKIVATTKPMRNAKQLETEIHKALQMFRSRKKGEWFKLFFFVVWFVRIKYFLPNK